MDVLDVSLQRFLEQFSPEMRGSDIVASADPRRTTCSLVEKTYLGRRAHASHSVVSCAMLAPLLYMCGSPDSATQMQKHKWLLSSIIKGHALREIEKRERETETVSDT